MICWHRQNVSCVQIVSVHHPGDITAMFAPDLHFLTRAPFSWVKNAEALQKIWNLEKFWGFGTRTAEKRLRQYLKGPGRRVGLIGQAADGGRGRGGASSSRRAAQGEAGEERGLGDR